MPCLSSHHCLSVTHSGAVGHSLIWPGTAAAEHPILHVLLTAADRPVLIAASTGGGAGGGAGSGAGGSGGSGGGSSGGSGDGEAHPMRVWTFVYAAFLAGEGSVVTGRGHTA